MKMFDMREILEKKVRQAEKAQRQWNYLLKRTQLEDKDYVILFPENDMECNYYGMLYLDTFLQRANGKKAVILANNAYVIDNIASLSSRIKEIILYEKEQVEGLLAWYELCRFDDRFIVVSLDKPYCRKAKGLIGVKGTTIEQLVAIGIYSIIPFEPLKDISKN